MQLLEHVIIMWYGILTNDVVVDCSVYVVAAEPMYT